MNKKKVILIVFLFATVIYIVRNKKNVDLEEIKNLDSVNIKYAYLNNGKLYIKQSYKEEQLLFSADLSKITEQLVGDNIVANNIIKIKKEDIKIEEKFSSYENNYQKILVVSEELWSNLVIRSTLAELLKMVPAAKNNGLLVALNKYEFVLYRDNEYQIKFCYVYEKPNNVTIKKTLVNQEINKIICNIIKNNSEIMKCTFASKILFQQNDGDKGYKIGLVDLERERIMYFDYWVLYNFKKNVTDVMAYISLLSSLVIKSHIYTIIKNPITSFSQLLSVLKDHTVKFFLSDKLLILDRIPEIADNTTIENSKINEILDKSFGTKTNVFPGKFKLLVDGDEYFLELIKEIENAKKEIKFRLYIFDNDDYGTNIATLLRKADDRNVKVKVLMDSFANITKSIELPELPFSENFKQPKSIKLYLKRKSDIQVKTSANTWLTFDHVKTLIFDDKIAFSGGMNIGQEYRYSWHDIMAKLEGPVVKAISMEFDNNWARNDLFGDLALLLQKIRNKSNKKIKMLKIPENSINMRLLYTKPWKKDIYKAQMIAIKNAKYRIYIENPYLADRRIINEIIKARGRGVDVRIILPKQNNVYLMAKNNNYLINILLKNGIRIFLYPGMTHVKASIYDDLAMIGSANFDMLSYDINKEFNVAFTDKNALQELEARLFEKDFGISEEITHPNQINVADELFSKIANRF